MTVELHGDGIVLRPLIVSDAEAHNAGEDIEQIRAFEFPGPAPIERVRDAIGFWQESWAGDGSCRNFGIWDATTGALVGNVEVRLLAPGRVNLSYSVWPEARRRGIATRAARLALVYARDTLDARTAVVKVLTDNDASLGVARKLGATEVGTEPSPGGATFTVFELPL
ncbi:MAG: GNAT family N-acetyltransferase [Acidimicrobiia bacterium]